VPEKEPGKNMLIWVDGMNMSIVLRLRDGSLRRFGRRLSDWMERIFGHHRLNYVFVSCEYDEMKLFRGLWIISSLDMCINSGS
jgi:hypothetical protein